MLEQDPDLLGADGEVHRAADTRREIGILGGPIGEVALLGDFEGTHQRHVDVAAPDHQEGVVVMEERPARKQARGALAGIDEIWIDLVWRRRPSQAEDAVLAVEHDFAIGGDMVGNQRRKPDAEIDVGTIAEVLGSPPGHLRPRKWGHAALLKPRRCGR